MNVGISKTLAKILSKDSISITSQNIKTMQNIIQRLINILIKGKLENRKQFEIKLKQSYATVMAFRQYFTNEIISYRIYYEFEDGQGQTGIKVYDLTEQEILQMAYRSDTALRLQRDLNAALKNKETNEIRNQIIQRHWNNIQRGLQPITNKGGQINYQVTNDIYNRYKHMNADGLTNKAKGGLQIFNKGHLFEAFEKTTSDLYQSSNLVPEIQFENKYFGTYLKRDTVKGFQTGDLDLIQIKARGAQLMEANTLISYLQSIKLILEEMLHSGNTENVSNMIKAQFTDPTLESLSPELENFIYNKVDTLVNALNKS